jgi:hypothetical protein
MLKKETLQTVATVAIGLGVVFLIVGSSQTFQSCIGEHYHHESSETFQKGVTQFLIVVKAGSACTGEFVHKKRRVHHCALYGHSRHSDVVLVAGHQEAR